MPKEQKKEKDNVSLDFVKFFGKIILREVWDKMTLEQKQELIPECD